MKNIVAWAVLASAVACTTSPVYANSKSSLCVDNTQNRVAIIVRGDGGYSTQGRLVLCDGKTEKFSSRTTTGKKQADGGVWTPEGNFKAGVLDKDRVSRTYKAPMPWSIHVYRWIFIHEGKVGNGYYSHGCIRLPRGKAETLFNLVDAYKQNGKDVHVVVKQTNPYTNKDGK